MQILDFFVYLWRFLPKSIQLIFTNFDIKVFSTMEKQIDNHLAKNVTYRV